MDKGFLLSIKDWYDAAIDVSTKDDKNVNEINQQKNFFLSYSLSNIIIVFVVTSSICQAKTIKI